MLLSPSAKAVVDAYSEANDCYDETLGQIAAALRAAADIVVPEPPSHWRDEWLSEERLGMWKAIYEARTQLLALATELENAD